MLLDLRERRWRAFRREDREARFGELSQERTRADRPFASRLARGHRCGRGRLLDVGSGVGGLSFELLDRGAERVIAVDASPAYLAAAAQEATRRDRLGVVEFMHGDFVDVGPQIPSATIVTLDRVICCYPSFEPLLNEALRHAEHAFAYSYPRDMWYVHCGDWRRKCRSSPKGQPVPCVCPSRRSNDTGDRARRVPSGWTSSDLAMVRRRLGPMSARA